MSGTAVVVQLISLICCVSGATLQFGGKLLTGSNVTLIVGDFDTVNCLQVSGPVPTSIRWYDPQGQLVSRDSGDEVYQAGAAGRLARLTFQSYQESQGGKYECRVAGPGNNLERLSICIGPTSKSCDDEVTSMTTPTVTTTKPSTTTSSVKPSPTPSPTSETPSKVVGVRVTPGVQNTSPTLTVEWQALAGGAVTYTVKYSTQPGQANTPPEGALEVRGISGTSTILTALERGNTYYIWVVGVSEGGQGPHSDRMSGVTFDNVPPPTDGSVSVVALNEAGKVRVTWSSPTLGSGQVITGYSVQYRRRGSTFYTTHLVSGSSTTSYTITNLNLGAVYEVRVASVGPLGLSGYCCGSGWQVTTYNLPGHVRGVRFFPSASENTLSVEWSRPQSDAPILYYEIRSRQRGYSWQGPFRATTEMFTIRSNLVNSYGVQVRAVSAIGAGPYSREEILEVTGPPLLSITSGSSWLYVEWSAQSATFRVLYRESGAPDYQVIVPRPSQLSHNISRLQPNTLYNIVVEATHTVTQQKVNSSETSAYTAPSAPASVSVQEKSADSIKVSWTPAPTASSVSVTYYINASSPTYQTVISTVSDPDREVVISGLHPFAEYYITVQAATPWGLSEPTGTSASTLTAAPSAPPDMHEVKEKGAHWAMVGWGIPAEAGRNGIIISYIVQLLDTHGPVVRNETVAVQDPTFDSLESLAHNFTSLKPYTRYVWRVAATTTAGAGPFTAVAHFTTLQSTPGPVSELRYEENTDTSVNITWKPPKEPNGVIAAYIVEHGVYQDESTTKVTIDARRPTHTVIRALAPGVPYNVTVRAKTAAGLGEPVSIVVFAVQQAPTAQVSNLKVERISSNKAALVSWTPLTLHQARGFPVYFVTYQPIFQVGQVVCTVNIVSTNDSSLVIRDLDPTIAYTFTVDVGTAGGKLRSTLAAVTVTLPQADRDDSCPASTDSSSATAVGLFLGGVLAGVLGLLLIEGIVCGACRLRRTKHKSSPGGKAEGENVPMDDNPAYGEVNIYDTVKELTETK